jgi:hypothetical protein
VHVVTQQFLDDNPERYPGMYVETFVNVPGKTYAGVGYTYDRVTDDFVPLVGGGFAVLVALITKMGHDNKKDHGIVHQSLGRIEQKIDGHVENHN